MKKLFFAALALAAALTAGLASGCSGDTAAPVTLEMTADGEYSGFAKIPADYTPDAAAADGCMVVVAKNVSEDGALYAGENVFDDFLAACKHGDAFMRAAYFLGDSTSYGDLIYKAGKYCYIDSERPDDITFFTKLRELKTMFGNPKREYTCYALTDSDDLTADDVLRSFLSSDSRIITDIPFKQLGFTVYLNTAGDSSTDTTGADTTCDYSGYIDITADGIGSAKIYKNPETCESAAKIDGKYYALGIGFGGYGLCDIKEYAGYLIYTYSFGSGLHRSHVGVLELATGETVFTSDPFLNIDVILDGGSDGVFGVYRAEVKVGGNFCELSLDRGDKLGELALSENGIIYGAASEAKPSTEALDALVAEICDNAEVAFSSNPYDYINARRDAFDALVAYGDAAVEYFVKMLRASETFGLDKYIMAAVCAEVTGVGADGGWSSAGEWLALYDAA